jgi:uncharacterized protein
MSGLSVSEGERASRPGRAVLNLREDFQEALLAARIGAGMTQAQLAARIGTTQSAIARLESGTTKPTVETLSRLADALGLGFEIAPQRGPAAKRVRQGVLTLADLRARRDEIQRVTRAHCAQNVRVFGSVARGDANSTSDIDLLIDINADIGGFAYFGLLEDLRRALEELLGCDVDVVDSAALRSMRDTVLREAVPL